MYIYKTHWDLRPSYFILFYYSRNINLYCIQTCSNLADWLYTVKKQKDDFDSCMVTIGVDWHKKFTHIQVTVSPLLTKTHAKAHIRDAQRLWKYNTHRKSTQMIQLLTSHSKAMNMNTTPWSLLLICTGCNNKWVSTKFPQLHKLQYKSQLAGP